MFMAAWKRRVKDAAPYIVGPSYGSFASGQARKLIPSAGPPLPTEPASLGFGGGPIGRADTIRPYGFSTSILNTLMVSTSGQQKVAVPSGWPGMAPP